MKRMKVTYQYMCDEICRFRGIMESATMEVWQKDQAFRTLMFTWIHSDHDMTVEEDRSLSTLIRAHGYEWTRRKAYEALRPEKKERGWKDSLVEYQEGETPDSPYCYG